MMIPNILKLSIIRSLKNSHTQTLYKPHLAFTISVLFCSSKSTQTTATTITDYLIRQHQLSHETAFKVSQSIKHVKTPETFDSVLSFFKEFGFSQTHIEKILKNFPRLLLADTENTLKPKIKIFQDLGFSHDDIVEIIRGDPFVLLRSAANRIVPSVLVLKDVVGTMQDVAKLLKLCGSFLKFDLEKTMLPNIEHMKRCGIESEQIARYITHFPRFFLYKPEVIRNLVSKTEKMGIERKSMMFLPAMRVLSSMTKESWESKVQLFQDLGFSANDVANVFRRTPQVLAISEKKIKDAVQVLLTVRDIDISYIVKRPELLIYSVEKRLRPRVEVFNILSEKNVLKRKIGFSTICKVSDQEFLQKYLTPHSKVLGRKNLATII